MKKEKTEFSKTLLVWETILIWVVTLSFIGLAYICIVKEVEHRDKTQKYAY